MSGEFWNGTRNHFRQRSFKTVKAAREFKQYVEEDGMRFLQGRKETLHRLSRRMKVGQRITRFKPCVDAFWGFTTPKET